jgi:hypothetical protein
MGYEKRDSAKKYTPADGDTLKSIAEGETATGNPMTWQDIARFNWGTDDPKIAEEMLRDELGCYLRGEDKRFVFAADCVVRTQLLIPVPFKKSGLSTTKTHTLKVKKQPPPPKQFQTCAGISGATFEFDKSFLRPTVADDLKIVDKAMKTNPEAKILIFGHTDKVGTEQYNKGLSERRAKSVYAFITNQPDIWETLYNEEHWGIRSVQAILKDMGDPYDPGPVDGIDGPQTKKAVKQFQTDNGLPVDGVAGTETRKKLFETYMAGKHDIEIDDGRFMDPKHMGCGEFNPQIDTEKECETNRRVTFYLFHPARLPNLPCKNGDIAPCKKQVKTPLPRYKTEFHCSFYDSLAQECKCEGGGGVPLIAIEYELIELVEVVTQDEEKWVKGAAMDCTDTEVITESVTRTDKDGSNFKQYINLKPDLEGQPKRHPEYGREIVLKARIKQKDGKSDLLAGIKIKFSFKRTDGPDRSNPGAPDPDVWSGTDLTGDQKEGFGSKNGTATVEAQTDGKGWTPPVSFFLSAYGGDRFEISAELAPGTTGAGPAPKKTQAEYVVWRKFWYQMTYATGYTPPQPTKAEAAYKEVSAEMNKSNGKVFTKSDLPADLQDRTFLKEYMLATGGANSDVAAIGGHNKLEFAKMMTTETDHPLKANLIICEYQCDPSGTCTIGIHTLKSNNQTVTVAQGSGGSIASKPALKAGAKLVVVGEWATVKTPWTKGGNITDANITIDSARTSTLSVKINLPKEAPAPTNAKPVYVKLQLETGEDFLGESFGKGQILCVYRPKAAAGTQGSEIDYNDTVAHEEGHMWNQTPRPAKQPKSMKDHPLQYVGHGGSGSHCRHGATVAAGAVNWQNKDEATPSPENGDCIMYHSFSAACSHMFCKTCKPYLQLQDMSSI